MVNIGSWLKQQSTNIVNHLSPSNASYKEIVENRSIGELELSNTNVITSMAPLKSATAMYRSAKVVPVDDAASHVSTNTGGSAMSPGRLAAKSKFRLPSGDIIGPDSLRELAGDKEKFTAWGGVKGVLKILKVDPARGIKDDEGEERQLAFGINHVPEKASTTYFQLLKEALSDATLIMLLTAAAAILVTWTIFERHGLGWIEGVSILGTVVFVINLQAYQDFKKEKEFRKLNQELNDVDVNVIRNNGNMITVRKTDVVVGDIIRLRIGDILVADGVLLEGEDIQMDESSLTGESEAVTKHVGDFLLSDTSVQNGQGMYAVTAVGVHTEAGNIRALIRGVDVAASAESMGSMDSMGSTATASTLSTASSVSTDLESGREQQKKEQESKRTVLQSKLDIIADKIGKLAMTIASIATIVMMVRYFMNQPAEDGLKQAFDECVVYFMTGVTIVVVAVPEGLPLAVTLALALSVRKMQRDHNLVKTLDSAETMGSATTICSDKTGTLTQNRMTAVQFYAGGKYAFKGIQAASHSRVSDIDSEPGSKEFEFERPGFMRSTTIGKLISNTLSGSDSFAAEIKSAKKNWRKQEGSRTRTAELADLLEDQHYDPDFTRGVVENICINRADAEIAWDGESGRWSHTGNITDCALLAMATEWGHDYKQAQTVQRHHVLKRFPFSSARKMGSTVVKFASDSDAIHTRVFVKGACEMVLNNCINAYGSDSKFDLEATKKIMTKMAGRGLRCIALAHKDLTGSVDFEKDGAEKIMESSLTLDCIVGIKDPLRPSVPPAIDACTKAGIDVRMVTGDNPDTAVQISRQAGILREGVDYILDSVSTAETGEEETATSEGVCVISMVDAAVFKHRGPCGLLYRSPYVVMTGPDFRKFVLDAGSSSTLEGSRINQVRMDQVWPYLRVLARSSPTDKYTLVSGMKESKLYTDKKFLKDLKRDSGVELYHDGQVIAVTGDGSNDAPALSKADVGFAMGITGTAVAKDAADIILLDDDFASIVQACLWGRNIHDSISKFLQFQLTVNIAAVCIACLGAFRNSESPLRTTQMLWVNLIMDSLGALALAAEQPTDALLERSPYGRNKSLVTGPMWVKMLGQAAYQLFVLIMLLFYGAGPVIPEDMYDTLDHPVYRCDSPQFCADYPEYCDEGLIEKYSSMFQGSGEASVPVINGTGRAGVKHMPSEHYTIIFHAFVWMTLFNWINCRKLHLNELNPFQGITTNPVFCIIWVICAGLQIGLVEIGAQNNEWAACHNLPARTKGLTLPQHFFCMALGVFSLPLQVAISMIARTVVPDKK